VPLCRLPEDLYASHHPYTPPEPPHWYGRRSRRRHCCCPCFARYCAKQDRSLGWRRLLGERVPHEHTFAQRPEHVHVSRQRHARWRCPRYAPPSYRLRIHGWHECSSSHAQRDAPAKPTCVSRVDHTVVYIQCERLPAPDYVAPQRVWTPSDP
jgi:hypothetical protein